MDKSVDTHSPWCFVYIFGFPPAVLTVQVLLPGSAVYKNTLVLVAQAHITGRSHVTLSEVIVVFLETVTWLGIRRKMV